jgi:two-component system LytT family response regulator
MAMTNGKWRVLVADDEPAARRGVRQLLASHPDFVVVGECRDGREVLTSLDRLQPDVLFLDIQMPELDGFDVIRRRSPERMPAVVFLTAYSKFALRAFDAEAHDYLVKPVTEARFAATMKRLVRRLTAGTASLPEPGIAVSTTRATKILPLKEIDWIEAADNYTRIWMGARSYLLRESLDSLEQRVGRHGFARAHRQALVRIAAVRELQNNDDGTITAVLASGTTIPVSRRRRSAFGKQVKRTGM